MVKRFTDTELWNEDWFIGLPTSSQFFWVYLKDNCDHAGIWRPNLVKIQKLYGHEIDLQDAIRNINAEKERIAVLDNGRLFLTGFIPFQYGRVLNLGSRMHLSVYQLLLANGVNLGSIRPQIEVTHRVKDKDKDKDSFLKEGDCKGKQKNTGFDDFWKAYPRKVGKDAARKAWAAKKPPLDETLAAIEAQKGTDQWTKDGGKFIPHPATWLNQGRWQDEITAPVDKGCHQPRLKKLSEILI